MPDKPASSNQPDLTPIFVLLLIIIIAGLGSVRSCGPSVPNTGCAAEPPTTVPVPPPGPPVASPLKQYTVKVGSFRTRDEARLWAASLRSRNINNFLLPVDGQWLVCVGQYPSASRASKMANTLISRGISEAVVLPPAKK
jgi:cell division septation protein DedD